MARRPVFPRLALLFLICSSCAWVGNGAAVEPVPVPAMGRREVVGGAGGAEPVWRRVPVGGEVEGGRPQPRSPVAAEPVRDGCHAMITPPPSLRRRQDQGQVQQLRDQLQQLSDASRQASQQLSQSSQQLSQSLQQASQQLAQTQQQLASARQAQQNAEQASRSISQASADASRQADQAQSSNDRVLTQSMQEASRALTESMASASRSMGASFSSALALATESAAAAMRSASSMALRAQVCRPSPKTAVLFGCANLGPRLQNDAQALQQAQGAALTVTQTALAVVGGIVGSSLLTGVAFVLVLRHRRKKRLQQQQQGARGDGVSGNDDAEGFPQMTGGMMAASAQKGYAGSDDGSSTYSTDDNGFPFPAGDNSGGGSLTRPAAAAATSSSSAAGAADIPRKTLSSKIGYAISYYGPRATATGPGAAAAAAAAAAATAGSTGATASSSSGAPLGGTNPRGGSITTTTTTASTTKPPFRFRLGNPPPPKWGASAATGGGASTTTTTTTTTAVTTSQTPAATTSSTAPGGKFTLFPLRRPAAAPSSPTSGVQVQDQPGTQTEVGPSQPAAPSAGEWPAASSSVTASPGGAVSAPGFAAGRFGTTATATSSGARGRGSRGSGGSPSLPSLDRWLRDGTDVSPFSTLNKIG